MGGTQGSPSIKKITVKTDRLEITARVAGSAQNPVCILIHGNVSSSVFFEGTMEALAPKFHVIAPDLRGFGETEAKGVDATRGVRDFSDDVYSLAATMGLTAGGKKVHLLGWSVGGGVAMQYAIDHASQVASIILTAPMSPFGFGGTRDSCGTPCFSDFAGSGGGTANPEFVSRIKAGDRSGDSPFSPLNIMNNFYFKPPFRAAPDVEAAWVESMLSTRVSDQHYPGNLEVSANWPTVAPGTTGMNNAISARYVDLAGFAVVQPRPDVLWLRGADDQIVSDTSLFDFGYLGQLGAVPGWPGESVFPAQPMVSQMRFVLDAYQAAGGRYREVVLADCGHSPLLEKPEEYRHHVLAFLAERA